jgi:hypothetical protein
MNQNELEILKNDIVNQPITMALLTTGAGLLAATIRYFWKRRKPKLSIKARFSLRNGDRGISIKIINYSDSQIRIDTVGYDIFGGSDPEQCVCWIKDMILDPKSSYEKFLEERTLHLETMDDATILFLKDQIGRLWKAPDSELVHIQKYNQYRKQYIQENYD